MLNEQVKNEVKSWVEGFVDINSDYFDFKVIMPDGKEIYVMQFIPRHCSPDGEYEPAWGPNMQGINNSIDELEKLQGNSFTEEEREELEEFAWKIASGLVKYTTSRWSQRYGNNLDYGTYTDCTEEEFEEAVNYVLNAPDYQREDKEEINHYYVIVDTRITD